MRKGFSLSAIHLFFAWVLAAGLLAACSNTSDAGQGEAAGADKRVRIAVIPKGSTHFFWKSVHAGAAKAAEEENVEIIWQGPQKEDDRQMQIQVVQNFVSRGVDGIVLAPLDDRSLVPPVKAAINRDIPVVIFDSDLTFKDYASFVATDNYEGGRLAAKQLASLMGGKGKAIMLRYSEGSASTADRERGFLEGMKEYGPQIELISTNQYAGATLEKAFQASQNLLNRFGNEVEGIYTPNESSTQGMLRALQTSGRAGNVKFVGFDSNETLLKALRDKQIHGLAVQDPFNMGYMGVKTAAAVVRGEKYVKRIDTGITMVTPENVDNPQTQELLNPDLQKWLNE
jgi:ribose transport system substrate-binding protein